MTGYASWKSKPKSKQMLSDRQDFWISYCLKFEVHMFYLKQTSNKTHKSTFTEIQYTNRSGKQTKDEKQSKKI